MSGAQPLASSPRPRLPIGRPADTRARTPTHVMRDLVLAALLALGFLAAMNAAGRLRFVSEEIPSPLRRAGALLALWGVLVACVFYPTVAPGDAADVDPRTLWFPSIFTGQLVLGGFLLIWWLLS